MSYSWRIAVVAAVLAAVSLTAGCGSVSAGDGGSDVPFTDGGADSGPLPLPESSPPATPSLAPITPAPGRQERVTRWELAGQADGGHRLLIDVQIGGPPCDTVTGVDVSETATTVTVTVQAGRLASADCPPGVAGSLATARVEARLREPLGERKLLGGA